MRRMFLCFALVAAIGSPSASSAQGLGDAARKEQENRSTNTKPRQTFTASDLLDARTAVPKVEAGSSGQSQGTASGAVAATSGSEKTASSPITASHVGSGSSSKGGAQGAALASPRARRITNEDLLASREPSGSGSGRGTISYPGGEGTPADTTTASTEDASAGNPTGGESASPAPVPAPRPAAPPASLGAPAPNPPAPSPTPTPAPPTPAFSGPAAEPELPRVYVDTTYAPATGTILNVPAGGNLQAALNAAQPGDTITLIPGAVYKGPIVLPSKPGSQWITIRTAMPDGSFPRPGTRVTPSEARLMPRLVSASGSVVTAAHGAHHYRLVGLEISPTPGTYLNALVNLSSPDGSEAGLPESIIIDRCYLHGDAAKGTRRGVALNSGAAAVIDSHLSDFKEVGADSQAIAGWNGPGPFRIANNYLEGAGENVLFGGADPSIRDLVPSDIEIVRNHFAKPLTWKADHPSYLGTQWAVKNLFELKNARRVLIEGNLFEQNWVQSQNGFAILFTVRNQSGRAPWSAVQDVTFRHNVVRSSSSGINILGRDDINPSQQTARIRIDNNLLIDIGGGWGGGGRLFQLLSGATDVVIEHNTARQTGAVIVAEGVPNQNFMFRYNLLPHTFGVIGRGTGVGLPTLTKYFPGAEFEGNVLAGDPTKARLYPSGNHFPISLDAVGFASLATGDYRLASSSSFRRAAPGGTDIGVDMPALELAMGTTAASRW